MGRKKYIHKFCKGCGSSIMIDRRDYDDPANDELCMNVSPRSTSGSSFSCMCGRLMVKTGEDVGGCGF